MTGCCCIDLCDLFICDQSGFAECHRVQLQSLTRSCLAVLLRELMLLPCTKDVTAVSIPAIRLSVMVQMLASCSIVEFEAISGCFDSISQQLRNRMIKREEKKT